MAVAVVTARANSSSESSDAPAVPQLLLGVSAGSVTASLVWPSEVPLQGADSKEQSS